LTNLAPDIPKEVLWKLVDSLAPLSFCHPQS